MDKKVQKCQIGKARYRTNGFMLDTIIKSLEIKNIEPSIQKNYQRVISEEDISVEEYANSLNTIIDDILIMLLKNRENENFDYMEQFIKEFFTYYTFVKRSNETLKCSQKQLDYIELVFTFIPIVALIATDIQFTSIMPMPEKDKTTFQQLFALIETEFLEEKKAEKIIYKYYIENKYEGYDTAKKTIKGWFEGSHIPDNYHLKMIADSLVPHIKNSDFSNNTMIYNMLLLSKIIQKLYNKSQKYFGQDLTSLLVDHYIFICMLELENRETDDDKKFDDNIVHNYFQSDAIINYLDMVYHKNKNLVKGLDMKIRHKNTLFPDEQKKTRKFIFDSYQQIKIFHIMDEKTFFDNIDNILPMKFFKSIMKKEDLSPIDESYLSENCQHHDKLLTKMYVLTEPSKEKSLNNEKELLILKKEFSKKYEAENNPYFNFIEARYHAQKREYSDATKYYLQALKYGKNCIGGHIKHIIEEGLIVSALETRKKKLDLKNSKSSFTKFYKEAYLNNLIENTPDKINQYFLNDTKKQFDNYFENLYPNNGSKSSSKESMLGEIKPDFSKPNKLIKNVMEDPISQLYYFCMMGEYQIIKKLLKNGADINYQREFDNSTILMATINAADIPEETMMKIINLFITDMNEDIIDAKLAKKNFSALYVAISKSYFDIVKLLLENRAEPNQTISTSEYTPLYHTLYCIYIANGGSISLDENPISTKFHKEQMIKEMHSTTLDSDKKDISEVTLRMMKNPDFKFLHSIFAKEVIDKQLDGIKDVKKLYQIFDLLLEYNPNLEFRKLPHNITPLMYATEINEIVLVKKLLNAGADKYAITSNIHDSKITYTALTYAKQNKNTELIELLK